MNAPIHFVNPVEGMDIVPDGWEGQDYKMVMASDFDRVIAERDALQLRLNAVEEENDQLGSEIHDLREALKDVLSWIDCSQSRSALQQIVTKALEKRP